MVSAAFQPVEGVRCRGRLVGSRARRRSAPEPPWPVCLRRRYGSVRRSAVGRCLQWLAVHIIQRRQMKHDEGVVTTSLTVTNSGRVATIGLFFMTWTGSLDRSAAGNSRSAWRNSPRSLLRLLPVYLDLNGQQARLPWSGSLGLQRTSWGLTSMRPFSQHLLRRIEEVNIFDAWYARFSADKVRSGLRPCGI